ncbi:OmpA family protein [Desulfosarcina sp.]|uniref:OmpA family protein n=1 Tax=Desulfosarcina sp. TaxID=2027861 RepID=UPI00356A0AB5
MNHVLRYLLVRMVAVLMLFPVIPTAAQKPVENKSGDAIARAIQKAVALATDHGAAVDVRLERFTGTIVGQAYREWDFSLRDDATIYRVRFDSSSKAQVLKRSEKHSDVREYWSTVRSANTVVDLDELVAVAQHKVLDAGFTPTDYTYLKYGVAGPRVHAKAPRETLEVFLEIAGEKKARRAIFHDRQYRGLTPAKIIKVRIPAAPQLPQPEIPTTEMPEVKIPEISDPNILIQENDHMVMITLWSDILFDFDKWDIRSDAKDALGQILHVLTGRYAKLPFEIHGHTDAMGIEAYNLNLSKQRAHAVKDWLVAHGIEGTRTSVYSHGELQPVAPNSNADGTDNPEGRQMNRRVDIRIYK